MINIFACTCPNRSGVGEIDNPDRFEEVFDPYYILEVPEKNFTHDISMVRRQKTLIFYVLPVKAFISKLELVHSGFCCQEIAVYNFQNRIQFSGMI